MPKKTRTTPPETKADTIRRLLSRKAGADLARSRQFGLQTTNCDAI